MQFNIQHVKDEYCRVFDELTAYKERERVLIAIALIELDINRLLKSKLDKLPNEDIYWFENLAFSCKLKLAYSLDLVSEIFYLSIQSLSQIRNKFAHVYECKDFHFKDIKTQINKLKRYNKDILKDISENTAKKVNTSHKQTIKILEEDELNILISMLVCVAMSYETEHK